MEILPSSPESKVIWWSIALTAAVWLLSGPVLIPQLYQFPMLWRELGAVFLLLGLWWGPGKPYLVAIFRWPRDLQSIPRYLVSGAIWITFVYSMVMLILSQFGTGLNDPLVLHFHSAAFLISFDLVCCKMIVIAQQYRRPHRKRDWPMTKAIIERLEHAAQSRPPFIKKTYAIVPHLYVGVGILCLLTWLAWFFFAGSIGQGAIQVAAILAVCSPWILILVLPNAFCVSIRATARSGILVNSANTIEGTTRLNALVFGKRGTLTQGAPRVADIIPMSHIDEEELLLWAASAEHDSRHPFGQAVVNEAKAQSIPLEPPERFTELTGRGVECVIDGQAFRLGKANFFKQEKIPAYLADRLEELAKEGKTSFICCREDQFLGIVAVAEELRSDTAAVIEKIRSMGLQVILLTGDDRMMAESLAERLHIDKVVAEVLPADKPRQLNKLRREGYRAGMVGSFPEDSASFRESDLGISLTRGEGLELPTTDVIMMEDKLGHVVRLLEIGYHTMRIARENRWFAFGYHGIAPLFMAGCLVPFGFSPISPVIAAMLSSTALFMVWLNNRRIAGMA